MARDVSQVNLVLVAVFEHLDSPRSRSPSMFFQTASVVRIASLGLDGPRGLGG